MSNSRFFTKKIFDSEVVAAGESAEYDMEWEYWAIAGYISLHIILAGSGTAKFTYESSNTGADYVVAEGALDILSSMTAGTKLVAFDPEFSKYMKIKIEETGGANSVTATVVVVVQ